jgi:hypothetical protein
MQSSLILEYGTVAEIDAKQRKLRSRVGHIRLAKVGCV